MTQLKAVKPVEKLRNFKTALTGQEANELALIIREFQQTNGAVSESVAKWMAKNLKKLKPVVDKTNLANKLLFEQYVERDGEKSVFWDYVKEHPKAIVNDNMLYSIEDGKPVQGNFANNYRAYVAGDERKAEFEQKRKEADEQKHEVNITQINISLFDKVNIPTQIDIVALYDILSFDPDSAGEEEELVVETKTEE